MANGPLGNEPRETRIHGSILAAAEKRLLVWLAERLPRRVGSDHLTALGAVALLLAGACYTLGRAYPAALVGVVVLLAVNWFGDSLDGTLARVRRQERPRYGFYVDHVLDALGILFLMGGLIAGGYMSLAIGAGFLVAYYLLTIEIALATHTLGTFRLAYWKIGPTELRIILAIGTLQLLRSDSLAIAGQKWLLFDVGGTAAIAGLLLTFVISAIGNTRELYRREPLPLAEVSGDRDRDWERDRDADRDNRGIHHRGNGANGGGLSPGGIHQLGAHSPIA